MRLHLHLVVVSICNSTRAFHTLMAEDGQAGDSGTRGAYKFLEQ